MTHCTHHTTQVVDMFGAGLPVLAVDFGCIGELVEVSVRVRVSMMWRLFWLKKHRIWICEMSWKDKDITSYRPGRCQNVRELNDLSNKECWFRSKTHP